MKDFYRFSLVILALTSVSIASGNDPESRKASNNAIFQNPSFRLPQSVLPSSYKLEMVPILDAIPQYERFTAIGKVWIRVNCTEATSVIKLHAVGLTIDERSVQVTNSVGEPQSITNFEYQSDFDFFVINLRSSLIAGQNYEIFIPFTTPVSRDRLDGMYLDSYVDPLTHETRYVATTLFAANSARRAFPCFDEPGLKAQFEIILGRAPDYHALSNMHVIDTQPMTELPGWFKDTFAPSPLMSTYLVCMIVSDLTYEEAPTSDPNASIHRVYAPYYFIDRGGGKYSANLSMTVLSAFESYYNMKYPLKKLDNVALPQFYYNAMENWGLMTYADRVLVYLEGETSEAQRYQLSLTVSHEVSHNFFGNVVTCQWWTHVWLNEGWATFASHLGLQKTYPDLRPWDQFVPSIYQVAMDFDSSSRTHPVANEPMTPADVGGIYDDIAYEKGASLIRMTEDFLTEPVLQIGVQRYLQKWQYDVAHQDDLFSSLQEVVEEVSLSLLPPRTTVKDILDTWTTQAGFPLIRVSRISNTEIMLSQEQFVLNDATKGNETWWVPITIQVLTGSNAGTRSLWMNKDQSNRTLTMLESELFLVNPNSIGYYRVLYSDKMFKEIVQVMEINHTSLEPSARMKLIDDSFALAFMDKIPVESALQLTSYIAEETDYFVWKTLRKHLGKIALQFRGTGFESSFLEYIIPKLQSVSKNPAFIQDRSPISKMLRDELSEWVCELDNKHCQENQIGPDFYSNIKFQIYNLLFEYHNVSQPSSQSSLKQSEIFDKSISRIASEGSIRQKAFEIIASIIQNLKSRKEKHAVQTMLSKMCLYSNSVEDILMLKQITANISAMNSTTTRESKQLQTCVNEVEANMQQINKYGPRINSWIIHKTNICTSHYCRQ